MPCKDPRLISLMSHESCLCIVVAKGQCRVSPWQTGRGAIGALHRVSPHLSEAEKVRLEDGQHINDSLLDFFVNRLADGLVRV